MKRQTSLTLLFVFFATLSMSAGGKKTAKLNIIESRNTISLNGAGWHLWQDKNASWKNDKLYLPSELPALSTLPVNAPTGGWAVLNNNPAALDVEVPGTVEFYTTKAVEPQPEHTMGVSWWYRTINVPAANTQKRYILRFESVRSRAEVYLDGVLVAYDIVGETPFTFDITDAVKPGTQQQLAVRVTNYGGNYHWQDFDRMKWGEYTMPPGRGFSGIIGRVWLDCVDNVYISDVYMQNTAVPTSVNAILTIENRTGKAQKKDIVIDVNPKKGLQGAMHIEKKAVLIPADGLVITIPVDNPDAALWNIGSPNLYTCKANITTKDGHNDTFCRDFGFRSFTLDGIGTDAIPHFNGRRVMLRSAISWGYFPATGLFATPEVAAKQIQTAKSLGLNMLNFHRSIGSPVVLEAADSLGLYYYEEPGAVHSTNHDPFLRALIKEKVRRMVCRDRSHPSLLIYNMINEFGGAASQDSLLVEKRLADMVENHKVDISRPMTFTSGWAMKEYSEEVAKAHLRPFDEKLYKRGWFDNHRAGGPATYEQSYYQSPQKNYMFTDNKTEIYMRGEEGAISTPPQLESIHNQLQRTGQMGWDGLFWENQYNRFKAFFDEKHLERNFGTLDSLCSTLGDIQLDHQGRRIQSMRMQNLGDVYVINGWESMPYDNHSGVVDIYRNPKGDAANMARYNKPLGIAVATRTQVVRYPHPAQIDFYALNEVDLKGRHVFEVIVEGPDNKKVRVMNEVVTLEGGDVYGQLLALNRTIPLNHGAGMYKVTGRLLGRGGKVVADGYDEMLSVDWNADALKGKGAIYGNADEPAAVFYKNQTGKTLPQYDENMGKLDWLIVTKNPLSSPQLIPASAFLDKNGNSSLKLTWYSDIDAKNLVGSSSSTDINRSFNAGAQPAECLPANQTFSAVWEGEIIPQESGLYMFSVETTAGIRLDINGERLVDEYWNRNPIEKGRPVMLEAGVPVKVKLLYYQHQLSGNVKLKWSTPSDVTINPQRLLQRAQNDGTNIIVLDAAESWVGEVAKAANLKYDGQYTVGIDWIGGVHFALDHPLLDGLPKNVGMGWPYQAVVKDGNERYGFRLHGEEMVVGSYRSWPFYLGTALGVVPFGKGHIVLNTLNISSNLNSPDGPSEVARKLLCNYLNKH